MKPLYSKGNSLNYWNSGLPCTPDVVAWEGSTTASCSVEHARPSTGVVVPYSTSALQSEAIRHAKYHDFYLHRHIQTRFRKMDRCGSLRLETASGNHKLDRYLPLKTTLSKIFHIVHISVASRLGNASRQRMARFRFEIRSYHSSAGPHCVFRCDRIISDKIPTPSIAFH